MKRFEIVANKKNDTVYFKTYNEVEYVIKAWELKKQGYTVKGIITE